MDKDKLFKIICLNIAKARIKKGLNANELSGQINRDPSYINKLENGKVNFPIKTLLLISEILEVDVKDLFNEII